MAAGDGGEGQQVTLRGHRGFLSAFSGVLCGMPDGRTWSMTSLKLRGQDRPVAPDAVALWLEVVYEMIGADPWK
jgi:hypothetical protein